MKIRRYTNKDRSSGPRGPKKRYSLWKAENNRGWERCWEERAKQLCQDNGLEIEKNMVPDDREPWSATFHKLWDAGYRFNREHTGLRHAKPVERKDIQNVSSWDSIKRLHKITGKLLGAANEIDELGVNIIDAGRISELLFKHTGVTLWKLREVCDELNKIEADEQRRAEEFDKYLNGEETKFGKTAEFGG